jgi:DNA-binding transcriptional LysR family regulator
MHIEIDVCLRCAVADKKSGQSAQWDEVKTAYHVASIGTVSGAAEALGVHHATVIRHIDALESHFGTKLFQRHSRGYTPTESGQELLHSARIAEEQFSQMAARIEGQRETISGELVVTSLTNTAEFLTPVLVTFQREHPEVSIKYVTDDRLLRLEHGEAHVALRVGTAPQDPDYVVRKFHTQELAMYVHQSYVDQHGLPAPENILQEMRFIGPIDEASRAPVLKWMRASVPKSQITYRAGGFETMREAVLAGAGAGFMTVREAQRHEGLVQVFAPREEWDISSWIVTHVDLHRTPKVQAFLKHLKASTQECPSGKLEHLG